MRHFAQRNIPITRAITVLSVELDNTPQIVHNLEVGGAHTYLVGELEAWGHNIGKRKQRQMVSYLHWWKNREKCGATGEQIPPPNDPNTPAADKATFEHNPAQSNGGKDGFGKNTCLKGRINSKFGNRDSIKPNYPREPW